MSIFISYAKDDREAAFEIYKLLKNEGFSPWIDTEDLVPGQNWELEIEKAVSNCKIFIACLSTHSVTKRGYVQSELKMADEVRKMIPEGVVFQIPVRLDDCEVPSMLTDLHWLDYFDEGGKTKLVQAIIQYLTSETPEITTISLTLPELIRIPAGEFIMGSDPGKDKGARSNEQPQHTVYMSEYYISKYPVTNVEYQAYILDLDQRHTSPREIEKLLPRDWDDTWYPKGLRDHPVVNITWSNANAYCKWLIARTGSPYRLPTEAEWEKAARGKDGRIYPWGNRWYSSRCNNQGSGINGTTPVDQYSPKGDSPYRVADMVGNVSEWCLDRFDMNEYKRRGGHEAIDPHNMTKGTNKVLRGGSFTDDRDLTRCAFRGRSRPGYWGWFYGFRVVVPPSSSEL